jgi:hypothetical protein
MVRSEWVVYAKPPFDGPHQVLKYLARYTHRVAIANQRLVALEDGHVSFRWKDYTRSGRGHDAAGDRVHSSLPTPRATARLCEDQALWLRRIGMSLEPRLSRCLEISGANAGVRK